MRGAPSTMLRMVPSPAVVGEALAQRHIGFPRRYGGSGERSEPIGAFRSNEGFDTNDKEDIPMIQVFSFDACPWCTKAKKYLDKKGVAYTVRDIEKEPAAYNDLVKLTGEGACPVILADSGEYVRGFDQPAIDRLLGI